MHFPHIRALDLSLLEPLYALLEERHVTRAADRCGISQSAMSRALDRLRSAMADELLVRSGGAYERTARGEQLLVDLHELLPRLDAVVGGLRFDPTKSSRSFRIATTDYAAAVLVPNLLSRIAASAPDVRLDVVPWNAESVDDIESGRIHVALIGGRPPGPFESEIVFSDEFVCVVARDHPLGAAVPTLESYAAFEHAVVAVGNGGQPRVERTLADHGLERRVGYRSPFQLSAILAASSSDMICTTARRLATRLAPAADVRVLAAPEEFPKIVYRMTWHRRLDDDTAHRWLRQQLRDAGAELDG